MDRTTARPRSRGRGGEEHRLIERRTIRFDAEALAGLELPCFEARGAADGPHLCLIAGIHGGEYSSIAAAVRFMNELDTSALSGRITAVPIVSMTSFRARTALSCRRTARTSTGVSPARPTARFTEVLAHHVFTELIAPSDVLIDLHGGDMVEASSRSRCTTSRPSPRRRRRWASRSASPTSSAHGEKTAPIGGTTSAAAADAGIPAVIAEAGGCGLLEETAVRLHLDGLQRALAYLGMLPDSAPVPGGQQLVDRFLWLRSGKEGWWEPVVRPARSCRRAHVGHRERNLFGDVLEDVIAPEDGVVLFLTSSPAVDVEGLLLGLGAGLEAIHVS